MKNEFIDNCVPVEDILKTYIYCIHEKFGHYWTIEKIFLGSRQVREFIEENRAAFSAKEKRVAVYELKGTYQP